MLSTPVSWRGIKRLMGSWSVCWLRVQVLSYYFHWEWESVQSPMCTLALLWSLPIHSASKTLLVEPTLWQRPTGTVSVWTRLGNRAIEECGMSLQMCLCLLEVPCSYSRRWSLSAVPSQLPSPSYCAGAALETKPKISTAKSKSLYSPVQKMQTLWLWPAMNPCPL